MPGEHLAVDCYSWGDPVGPYANHIWYRGLDVERPSVNGHANYGYMNTHYVNDGMTADHPASGIPDCSAPPPPPPPPPPSVTPCTFNFRWSTPTLTFNYRGAHTYYGNAWQAAKNWTNLGLPLSVVPAPFGAVGQITFTDVNRPSANWDGRAQITNKTPYTTHLGTYANPTHISIYLNTAKMAGRTDFQRTLVATHELGHALGLAHPDAACGITTPSIMTAAGQKGATTNTPLYYDRINLEQLYGWPTG